MGKGKKPEEHKNNKSFCSDLVRPPCLFEKGDEITGWNSLFLKRNNSGKVTKTEWVDSPILDNYWHITIEGTDENGEPFTVSGSEKLYWKV